MMPGYIQGGTYAGSGVCFVGAEDQRGSPFECTVEITENGARFQFSGYFRRPTDNARHQFSGSFSTLRRAVFGPAIDAIDLRVAALEFTGVLSNAGTSVLIQASSNSGEIQISQRWEIIHQQIIDEQQLTCQYPPMHYSLSFGNVDPRLAKANVLALGKSA